MNAKCFLTTLILILLSFSAQNAETSKFKPQSNIWYLKSSFENNHSFILVGTNHGIGDHSNPQLTDLENIFSHFKPDLVLLEGGFWPTQNSIKDAIECCGEMGFANYLAQQQKATINTWDPNSQEEVIFLRKSFSEQDIQLFYTLRQVPLSFQEMKNNSPSDILQTTIKNIATTYNLEKKTVKLRDFEALLKSRFGQKYNLAMFKDFDIIIKQPELSQLALIKSQLNQFRDDTAIRKTKLFAKKFERILLLGGKEHFRPIMAGLK